MWLLQLAAQIVTPEGVFDLIEGGFYFFSPDFQREPRLITAGNVGALGALFSALAFFDARQLFQFAMQSFDHPTHLVFSLNNLRVDGTWGSVGDHPVNVAV